MNLGSKILELRKQKNVTQEELAAELGVTAAAVSKWENGYTLPDILMLCALSDFFAVTTDELLGRTKEWKYALIAAETMELGKRAAVVAKEHGLLVRGIYTTYEEAEAAVDDSVEYLVSCFFQGFYGACPNVKNLVSVGPDADTVLRSLKHVLEHYMDG